MTEKSAIQTIESLAELCYNILVGGELRDTSLYVVLVAEE
jgi:hypothetical protein